MIKLGQVRVFQNIQHGVSFLWVELKCPIQEVQAITWTLRKPVFLVDGLYLGQQIQHLFTKVCFQCLDVRQRRGACPGHDPFNLVQSRVARKEGFSPDYLAQQAPEAPSVNGFRVLS